MNPGRSSPGVQLLYRARPLRVRPCPSTVFPDRADAEGGTSRDSGPPLLGFLLPRTPLRRVPLLAATVLAVAEDEGRQALAGAVLRVLAPLDGSGCARGASRTPAGARSFAVAPRRFAALFHAARVPWSRPAELSLPGEPCPLSRAVASLRVRVRLPPARRPGGFATAFTAATSSLPRDAREGESGRRSRDDGSPRPLGQAVSCPRRHVLSRPFP